MYRRLRLLILAGALSCVPALVLAPAALAQQVAAQTPYRLLDLERLLQETLWGQQVLATNHAAERALEAENESLAGQLAVEERALTDLRASLSPEEFRARADAFDARVEQIRTDRNQRSEALSRQSEQAVQRFFNAALPVLDQLMRDEGVVGLLRPEVMVLWVERLDITDLAIARMDGAFAAQDQAPVETRMPDAVPQP